MSRVLLFVQTGDARPKCYGPTTKAPEHARGNRYSLAFGCFDTVYGTHRQHEAQVAADRWWLVECANAEDGRFVIECDREAGGVLRDHYASDGERIYGRILASGGKR